MSVYRYLLADLRTNAILAELPLTGVSFTQSLNSAGSFNARLLLSDPRLKNYDIQNTTIPARTAIYVDRDGVLVWGGILWTRTYASDTQTMSFTGREFESYFERRRIVTSVAFNAVDQLTIAQSLVTTAQSATGGNIGITVPSNTSGVTVSRVYYAYELKDVWSAVKDLSTSSTGFDINIDVAYDSFGTPQKYLRTDYPYRGIPYVSTNAGALVFELPGNVIQYEYPDEGNATANTMYAVGPGSNEGKLIGAATVSTQVASGWPLLEDTTTYNDVYDPTLLTNLAAGEVVAKQNPIVTAKIVVPAYVDPVLGSYKTGDQCLLRITDDRWVQQNGAGFGLTAVKRIVAIAVQPGEDSGERVTLTLADLTS